MVPAAPPLAILVANLRPAGASLEVLKAALIVSLKAKLSAWVGKYRSTLARFPETDQVKITRVTFRLTPPEGVDPLGSQHPLGAVNNTLVRLVKTTLEGES